MINYNLPNDVELIEYTDDTWLDERRKGIGGSDVAAILGESKHSSPLKVYKDKVDGIREDVSDKVFVRKGRDLEAFVRNIHCVPYFNEIGYDVVHPQHIFVNKNYPWIRANLDGLAVVKENEFGFRGISETNIVIEIKWVSEWAEDAWDDDRYGGVPVHYYMQVQTYMAVTGAKKAVVFALFDKNWEVRIYEIKRNEATIAHILSETEKFYKHNMCMKIPPTVKASIDTADVVEKVKTCTMPTVGSVAMAELVSDYITTNAQLKSLADRASQLRDEIIAMHLDGKYPEGNAFKVKLSTCTTSRFNTTAFKEAQPELYAQFVNKSEFTKFTVK